MEYLHKSFKKYAEPLVESLTLGDVVSVRYNVIEGHSVDRDTVAKTRFRNTLNVSVYAGVGYTLDALALCRENGIHLITEEIFEVISVYYWINPIYRTQFLGITGTEADYESMLFTSDKITQKHIKREMELTELQSLILDVIRFRTAKFTNRSIKGLNVYTEYNNAFSKYKLYMEEHHKEAYHTARNFPAQQCLVDENGFILLEQNQSDEELKGEIKNE